MHLIKETMHAVFYDLAKTFETVSNVILPLKLQHNGSMGNRKNWFKSNLINRKQAYKISNILSGEKSIICGLPQGSILGPIPFYL